MKNTDEKTIATTVALRKAGKIAIVVGDKPGFYVNRILAPYISEALTCLVQGNLLRILIKHLFSLVSLGPIQLLDEVGIDIGTKITILVNAFEKDLPLLLWMPLLLMIEKVVKWRGFIFMQTCITFLIE